MSVHVLVIGHFHNSEIGGSFLDAFRACGCQVSALDPLAHIPKAISLVGLDHLGKVPGMMVRAGVGAWVLKHLPARPNIIFFTKGVLIPKWALRELKRLTGATLVNFNPDDPFNLNGSSSLTHIVDAISSYDLYLTWATRLVTRLRDFGAQRAEYLPFAADLSRFFPVTPNPEQLRRYASPLTFIGNWDAERERWLQAVAPLGLAIWGSDWDKASSPAVRAAWRGPQRLDDELRAALCAGSIQLNILRLQNKTGHNMRTFEIPACGAFMLTERSEDLPLLFKEDLEVAAFGSIEELVEKARYYLANEEKRRAIAAAGLKQAQHQTYIQRARSVLNLIAG